MTPTNLTDEGLNELARKSMRDGLDGGELDNYEKSMRLHRSIVSYLKQVRDAAKKEEREAIANYVGEHWGYVVATAIRQMDGGK